MIKQDYKKIIKNLIKSKGKRVGKGISALRLFIFSYLVSMFSYSKLLHIRFLTIITIIILFAITTNYNIVFAMEQSKTIAEIINNGNIHLGEEILRLIRQEGTLTDEQYRTINMLINDRLQELNPETNYRVNDLTIQNQKYWCAWKRRIHNNSTNLNQFGYISWYFYKHILNHTILG